jgi:hypothetical protein
MGFSTLVTALAAVALLGVGPTSGRTLIETDAALQRLFTEATAPGVYELSARRFDKPGPGAFSVERGALSGTPDQPVVIRGRGIDLTVIECPGICYFSGNSHVVFEDLTIHGAVNSAYLKHWTFRRVKFKDTIAPGGGRDTFGGQFGGIVFKTAGGGGGAGPLLFENVVFDPAPIPDPDTTLDFVGVQGVEVIDSVFERCNRGCMQAKGGSGTVIPFRWEGNLIKDAGQRGVFFGGGAGRRYFDPPIEDSRHEFGAAIIRNNVIIGGWACFVGSTFGGPVLVENNLCIGQSRYYWRVLRENDDAEIGRTQGLTIRRNFFVGFTGWTSPAFNYSDNASARGHFKWKTFVIEENVFERDPEAERYWPRGLAVRNNITVAESAGFQPLFEPFMDLRSPRTESETLAGLAVLGRAWWRRAVGSFANRLGLEW